MYYEPIVTRVDCWEMRAAGEPLVRAYRDDVQPGAGQARIRVAGCGVCHTDLGYLYDGVRTRHPLPLTLGHEISGVVDAVGSGVDPVLVGAQVIVPAVIPCGSCELCARQRGAICRDQVFPGNDVHGGFASHVVVPARGLCPVPAHDLANSGLELAELSVVADAVSTPYQAVVRSKLGAGDVAIFVGIGGVGGFGAQIARALGAGVIALDVDPERLARLDAHCELLAAIDVRDRDARALRKHLREVVAGAGLRDTEWKIFETSGTAAGQRLAFDLLGFGAHLAVVGYTMDRVEVRLSNLMAFDATAQGTWGCPPELYPAALHLVLTGGVRVRPFIEHRPMRAINDTFDDLRAHRLRVRPVLIPDFDEGE